MQDGDRFRFAGQIGLDRHILYFEFTQFFKTYKLLIPLQLGRYCTIACLKNQLIPKDLPFITFYGSSFSASLNALCESSVSSVFYDRVP